MHVIYIIYIYNKKSSVLHMLASDHSMAEPQKLRRPLDIL